MMVYHNHSVVKARRAHAHWLSFQDYVDLQGLNNVTALTRFKLTLRDNARLWLDSVKPTTLKELKSGFEGKFSGLRSRDTVLEKWNSLRYEGETYICDFLAELKRLADILEYEARTVKDKFLMCLPANVRVEAAREQELEKCATAAQNYIDITGVTNKMKEIAFSSQQVSFKDKRRNQIAI